MRWSRSSTGPSGGWRSSARPHSLTLAITWPNAQWPVFAAIGLTAPFAMIVNGREVWAGRSVALGQIQTAEREIELQRAAGKDPTAPAQDGVRRLNAILSDNLTTWAKSHHGTSPNCTNRARPRTRQAPERHSATGRTASSHGHGAWSEGWTSGGEPHVSGRPARVDWSPSEVGGRFRRSGGRSSPAGGRPPTAEAVAPRVARARPIGAGQPDRLEAAATWAPPPLPLLGRHRPGPAPSKGRLVRAQLALPDGAGARRRWTSPPGHPLDRHPRGSSGPRRGRTSAARHLGSASGLRRDWHDLSLLRGRPPGAALSVLRMRYGCTAEGRRLRWARPAMIDRSTTGPKGVLPCSWSHQRQR